MFINFFVSDQVYHLLTNHFAPNSSFIWPEYSIRNEKRRAKQSHLDAYKQWLVISPSKMGYFCLPCALFAPQKCTQNPVNKKWFYGNRKVSTLVFEPLYNFRDLFGKRGNQIIYSNLIEIIIIYLYVNLKGSLDVHNSLSYHEEAVQKMIEFRDTYENPSKSISAQIGGTLRNSLEKSRESILKIIETGIFLAKRGMSLRGHRDSGPIDFENENVFEGAFRDLIKFTANRGNSLLKNYLQNSDKNASYISPQIQNLFLKLISDQIVKIIQTEIRQNKFYAIAIDETQDISKSEQLVVVIRYFFNGKIKERVIGMFDAFLELSKINAEHSLTGENIAKIVVKLINDLDLDPNYLVFTSTDGASVMTGSERGFTAFMKTKFPFVSSIICNSHNVNNSLGVGNLDIIFLI